MLSAFPTHRSTRPSETTPGLAAAPQHIQYPASGVPPEISHPAEVSLTIPAWPRRREERHTLKRPPPAQEERAPHQPHAGGEPFIARMPNRGQRAAINAHRPTANHRRPASTRQPPASNSQPVPNPPPRLQAIPPMIEFPPRLADPSQARAPSQPKTRHPAGVAQW